MMVAAWQRGGNDRSGSTWRGGNGEEETSATAQCGAEAVAGATMLGGGDEAMTVAAQHQEEVTALAAGPTSITKHGSALVDRALAGSWSTSRDRGQPGNSIVQVTKQMIFKTSSSQLNEIK
uniref:Uncharacterized protein n=1 Tax=Oryza meridionalis TaxID=40149 RepID=A0A0E0CIJ7_9ORYZ